MMMMMMMMMKLIRGDKFLIFLSYLLKSVIIIEFPLSSFTTVTLLEFNFSVIYFITFFSFKAFLPLNLECY